MAAENGGAQAGDEERYTYVRIVDSLRIPDTFVNVWGVIVGVEPVKATRGTGDYECFFSIGSKRNERFKNSLAPLWSPSLPLSLLNSSRCPTVCTQMR